MPSDTGEISPVLTKRRALNGSVLSPNASTILDQVIAHKKGRLREAAKKYKVLFTKRGGEVRDLPGH